MKNYILLLGVAGVVLGSYCAYAANSATMTVTATIAHDVSLTAGDPLNMGTLTINPSIPLGGTMMINPDGSISGGVPESFISLTGFSAGTFTANVPDSCKVDGVAVANVSGAHPCFRVETDPTFGNTYVFEPYVIYVSGNNFRFMYNFWAYDDDGDLPTSGNYSGSVTIKYVL
ncbi:MAG: hypothetical protein IJ689_04875 [Alphaproteobacteria bacterium]|nr:hypothetical protein [Alphaproteobacteria bacterium]